LPGIAQSWCALHKESTQQKWSFKEQTNPRWEVDMFLTKVLGAVFVSLILFMPEYLPKDAFAACCNCNQCKRGCTCGCACGDENGKTACIVEINKSSNLVKFKEEGTGEIFELPYDDELLDERKVGDCGMIKTKKEEVQVCTGFAIEPRSSQQSQQQDKPLN
jgi:hypothetical protein